MDSSGSDYAPSSVLCRAPPCHGSPSSPPSPHAGKFIGRWWMIWTEIAPIWRYYENVVEKNGNGNCRLIFLPSSPSSTSTRMFLPQTPRWVDINLPSNILTNWHHKQSSSWHHKKSSSWQQNLIFSWHQKQPPTCQPGASGSPNPDLCGKSLPSAQFSA